MNIEKHPLPPFLPANSKLLMLGSFPPPQKRWSIPFYYPNMQNDMWRIFGLLFFEDKEYFVDLKNNCFNQKRIVEFLELKGIAIYDTAESIRRLKNNASDKYLEVVEATDINQLLSQIPHCHAIVTTGEKATTTICNFFKITQPAIGRYTCFEVDKKTLKLFRMPSSSRAYPLALTKKADVYKEMFTLLELLD